MIKKLFKKFSNAVPQMNEETATMLSKYNKNCKRQDIVDRFIKKLNKDIYDNARLGLDHLTVTSIPTEAVLSLKKIVEDLRQKNFHVGVITEPYPIIAIKWDIELPSIAINKAKELYER